MRTTLLAIALLSAASSGLAEPPGGIAWQASFDQAKTRAAGEGKLLFVEFLTDG
ncbi:MAG: hypothetical protein HYY18_14195 [Planctomycetes bacterium]|nr:hypothetical protein [Planctomycetota bacterium]